MFADDFLSISLAEVLGLIVTVVGIWLVVKQLNETRLASQMEGILMLQSHWGKIMEDRRQVVEKTYQRNEWESLSVKEAYRVVFENKESSDSFLRVANYFEDIGLLVRAKALDKKLAYRGYGLILNLLFDKLEKVIHFARKAQNNESIYENWEWLTLKLENLDN